MNIIVHNTINIIKNKKFFYEVEIYNDGDIILTNVYTKIVVWHEKNIKNSIVFHTSSSSIGIYYECIEDVMAFKLWFL